jgi:hypothetical protein
MQGQKLQGKRMLKRSMHVCDNIKVDVGEMGYGLDLIGSGYDRTAGVCEHCNKPSYSMKAGNLLTNSVLSFQKIV